MVKGGDVCDDVDALVVEGDFEHISFDKFGFGVKLFCFGEEIFAVVDADVSGSVWLFFEEV